MMPAIALVPMSGTVESERTRRLTVWGVSWSMTMDWSRPGGLGDLKTTAREDYALTADELRDNIQALCYAYALLLEQPALEQVELTWLYALKGSKPKAWTVDITIPADEVRERFEVIHQRIALPVLNAVATGEEMPRNLNAKFCGSCQHRTTCLAGMSPSEVLTEQMQEREPMPDLFADIANLARQTAVEEERFAPDVQHWIDAHPPEARSNAIAQAKAAGYQPLAPEPPIPALPSHVPAGSPPIEPEQFERPEPPTPAEPKSVREPAPRKRGRPKKVPAVEEVVESAKGLAVVPVSSAESAVQPKPPLTQKLDPATLHALFRPEVVARLLEMLQ